MIFLRNLQPGFSTHQFIFLDQDGQQKRFHISHSLDDGSCDTDLLGRADEVQQAIKANISRIRASFRMDYPEIEELIVSICKQTPEETLAKTKKFTTKPRKSSKSSSRKFTLKSMSAKEVDRAIQEMQMRQLQEEEMGVRFVVDEPEDFLDLDD